MYQSRHGLHSSPEGGLCGRQERVGVTFLPRSKRLLISWLQLPSAVILEPPKIKSDTVSTVSPSIYLRFPCVLHATYLRHLPSCLTQRQKNSNLLFVVLQGNFLALASWSVPLAMQNKRELWTPQPPVFMLRTVCLSIVKQLPQFPPEVATIQGWMR